MMKKITSILVFIFLLATVTACSIWDKQRHPANNSPLILQGKANKPQLYLLHNQSKQPLYINHETGHGMSAGWASKIDAEKWSAFLVDRDNFTLVCQTIRFKSIACKNNIAVSEKSTQRLTKQQSGTYWVAENQSYTALVNAIKSRKISIQPLNVARP